jgi:hypothetical protein
MHIHISTFMGMAPKLAPRKLLPGMSQFAQNVELWSGEMKPIKTSRDVVVPTKTGPLLSLYPLGGEWLHWTRDVDAVLGPIELDETERTYYSGDLNPKSTNIAMATTGGTDYPVSFFRMGLPKPDDAPTVTPDGSGIGADETRSYIYTFVTDWGEESRPSDPTEATGPVDDVWNITAMQTTPANVISISTITHSTGVATITHSSQHLCETGEYFSFDAIGGAVELNGLTLEVTRVSDVVFTVEIPFITAYTTGGTSTREAPIQTNNMRKWIYRTDANGVFRFVVDIPAGDTSYADSAQEPGVLALVSAEYYAPPGNMQGLIVLPNGIMAGFFGNQLCLAEPGQPHAWPIGYRQTTKYAIVAIEAWGNRIVVATKGTPEMWTGFHPNAASMTEMRYEQACISKRSIASLQSGVIYASPDGLVMIGDAGPRLLTENVVKKDEWDLYNPASLIGVIYDNRYYGFYSGAGVSENDAGGIVFDPSEPTATFSQVTHRISGAHTFREEDGLYFIEETQDIPVIRQYDDGGGEQQAFWQSGVAIMRRPVNFKTAKVRFFATTDITEAERAQGITDAVAVLDALEAANQLFENGSWGGSALNSFAINSGPYLDILRDFGQATTITFHLYALDKDDNWVLRHTESVGSDKAFRLPGGYRADEYYIELTGAQVRIHEVSVAETMKELTML